MSGLLTPLPAAAPRDRAPGERFVSRLLARLLKEEVGELELGRNADFVLTDEDRRWS